MANVNKATLEASYFTRRTVKRTKKNNTLYTIIPRPIVKALGISPKQELRFAVRERNGERYIEVCPINETLLPDARGST
jgi:bifunctional DNA-binding transcriptional regulator/antitoxin component of YhaV-PrlF toxin-antitoxin module